MALAFVAVVTLACVVAATLLLFRAAEEREQLRQQTLGAAVALTRALDQEVAAMHFLLRGLSTSPALRAKDYKGFYDQLSTTPLPQGSWLILNDLDGQVLNTLRPFGTALPRHSDFPTSPVPRVREVGWSVSGRSKSLVRPGATTVGLGLRVVPADEPLRHFLTVAVSDLRLRQLVTELRLPASLHMGAFDRRAEPLFDPATTSLVAAKPVRATITSRLAGIDRGQAIEGLLDSADDQGGAILVGFSRSATTDWTAVAASPAELINSPLRRALEQIAATSVFLLVVGAIAAYLMSRHLEKPIAALSSSVTAARHELGELSEQLLALQEDERRRIARELHDSTAQHMIAGTLGLMKIATLADRNPAILKACADIESSLRDGLRELRIFTYLLHPPNLESEGLRATLHDFVDGFCRRTGLDGTVRISCSVDDLPFELQRTLLRVVQEAMANVQRHAMASRVSLAVRERSGHLLLRITDNGKGIADVTSAGEPQRLGVGILGMRARLRQFGGDLTIKSKPSGTTLVAVLPVGPRDREDRLRAEPSRPASPSSGPTAIAAE